MAVFGGAQGGASCAYFRATRRFLLLLFLLFSSALWCSSHHSQVVDPVGFWVGDFAEGDFVEGWVVWSYQQEEKCREAKRPGTEWQSKLGGDRTDRCTLKPFTILSNTMFWEYHSHTFTVSAHAFLALRPALSPALCSHLLTWLWVCQNRGHKKRNRCSLPWCIPKPGVVNKATPLRGPTLYWEDARWIHLMHLSC